MHPVAQQAAKAYGFQAPSGTSAERWRIYIGKGFTKDTGEGPFETQDGAVEFAENEVGVPWSVRKDGAKPKKSDPRWGGETLAQKRERVAAFERRGKVIDAMEAILAELARSPSGISVPLSGFRHEAAQELASRRQIRSIGSTKDSATYVLSSAW